MRKKAEYRSAIRSRKLIREAFAELMNEKPIDKITVTDIVNKADINRGTFYAHYADTRAVIEQIENEIIDKMIQVISAFRYKSFIEDPKPILNMIAKSIEEEEEYYKKLINAHGSEQFIIKLRKILIKYLFTNSDIPDEVKSSKEFEIRVNFFAGGMTTLYHSWFLGELQTNLVDITNEIVKQVKAMLFLLEKKI
ncbi:MAG TPA: TetR/AcrR family transcriptional regulator [Haloplasmataceae bacterium]